MSTALKPDDFNYIRDLLKRHSAMILEADKQYLIELRLTPLLRQLGLRTIPALIQELRMGNDPELQQTVLDALLNNETLFFRDISPFQCLKEFVIPALKERQPPRLALNIWSAACSFGQEPYSIAMLIKEHFPEIAATWNLNILATDLSHKALSHAKEGIYKQLEINRGLPASYLIKYFLQIGTTWEVKAEIKQMIEFKELNLTHSWPLVGQQDIIFLRNVLIYFDISVKKDILEKIRMKLKPNGYLFLGSGETTIGLSPFFERIQLGKSEVYRLKK